MRQGAQHASVNGLSTYYEVHGSGPALVLLHGGTHGIEASFEPQIPFFAKRNTIIAPEQQGHGRTADIDREPTYEQFADDTAALLRLLKVQAADLVGWSDGGMVALLVAIRHPNLVRKVVASGAQMTVKAYTPQFREFLENATPEEWAGLRENVMKAYVDGAAYYPTFIAKMKKLWLGFADWDPDDLRAIAAPVMIVAGDHDAQPIEHHVEMWRLIPNAQLCVLPGTGHGTFRRRADWLNPIIAAFLDEPLPDKVQPKLPRASPRDRGTA